MRIRVRVLNTSLKGLQFECDKAAVRVGRSGENDLVLQDHSVSRSHASLTVRDGRIMVEDLGSRNGTKVRGVAVSAPTPVESGTFVSFGDVVAEVSLPDLEGAAADEAESTPAAAAVAALRAGDERPGCGGAVPGAAIPAGWLARRKEGGPAELSAASGGLGLWTGLTLVLGLAAAGMLVLFFLSRSGALDEPRERPFGVSLCVGEDKVVQVPRGFVLRPVVERPGVVKVSRPLNLDVAVQLTGASADLTTVTLYNEAGEHIRLHVKVLPRKRQDVDELFQGAPLSAQERRELAREKMRLGEVLRDEDRLYEAMQQYDQAIALLEFLAHDPPEEYLQARRWKETLSDEVQKRYEQLTFEMGNFVRDGDKAVALARLAEIKSLIPDERDVRRQNADLLFELLEQVIEREKGRPRRGQ